MSTPAGWYDDGHGVQRWWDGTGWTENVQPATREADADAAPAAALAGSAPSGAYPGAPSSPPAPQEQPKKSKLWILWVVLGGVVVLLLVAAAILVPLLIGLFASAGSGVSGSSDDERAAVDTVLAYDDAFDDVDCALYERTTTSAFRETAGYADCDSFVSGAETFDENTEEYEVEVTGVDTGADGTIIVSTRESYLSNVGGDGNPLDTPEEIVDPFEYTLVDEGGRWAIDDIR